MAQPNDDDDRQLQEFLDANPEFNRAIERRIARAAEDKIKAAEDKAATAEVKAKTLKYVWLLHNRCAVQARRASGLRF